MPKNEPEIMAAHVSRLRRTLKRLALFSLADLFGFLNDSLFADGTPAVVVGVELVAYALAIVGLAVWGIVGYRRSTRG